MLIKEKPHQLYFEIFLNHFHINAYRIFQRYVYNSCCPHFSMNTGFVIVLSSSVIKIKLLLFLANVRWTLF